MWAQLVLRAFARSTNLLISGQQFVIVVDSSASATAHVSELRSVLHRFGAQVSLFTADYGQASLDGNEAAAATLRAELSHAHASFFVTQSGAGAQEMVMWVAGSSAPKSAALGIRVLAPVDGQPVVIGPDNSMLFDPYHPGIGHSAEERGVYGAARIEWARQHMPVTQAAVHRLASTHDLAGKRIGLSLVLEPKTAVLALELAAAGAQVHVFGHADETRDDVAQVLRERGLHVYAESTATPQREEELAREFLGANLQYLLDDGSHLIRMAHDSARAPQALTHLIGAAEETTSGLRPLRAWQADGLLQIPVMASNDARSKTLFDNAYGTGQSCLLTTLDLIDPTFQGVDMSTENVVVIGYGDVGKGFARFSAALGARVSVVELDPVRLLQARMDGYLTGTLLECAPSATMLVSATGERDTITVDALRALPRDAVVTVAGGVDQEVATEAAVTVGAQFTPVTSPAGGVARQLENLLFPDGHSIRIADRGGCINCTAGEGNPIEIMDLSFAVQTASLGELLSRGRELPAGLHSLPAQADNQVSAAALAAWPPLTQGSITPIGRDQACHQNEAAEASSQGGVA